MALKDELKKQADKKRPRTRTPLMGRNVLTVADTDKDPDYHYRIVNDVGDRVEILKEIGYEVVTGDVRIGDKRVANPSAEGSPVTAHVGGGIKGVLMRQRKEHFTEDQLAKQDYVDSTEAETKSTAAGDYGKIDIQKPTK